MSFSSKLIRTSVLSAALSALCVVSASAASLGIGTVSADALRLRKEANTSSAILATAAKGDNVVVLEDAGNGWYKVDFQTVEGYMSASYLTVAQTADVTIGYGLVKTGGSSLNVRSGPGTGYGKLFSLNDGAVVTITGISSGWYKISYNGKTGYVSSDYMVTCKDSAGSRGDASAAPASSSLGQQVVDYAKQFLGKPYVYGASGPNSFDCSGFTTYVYKHFGYTLNRTATGQLSNGTAVSKSELRPGDLVFFKSGGSKPVSHVGIYVGNGQFIHASTNGVGEVRYDSLNSTHYNNAYVYARRIF